VESEFDQRYLVLAYAPRSPIYPDAPETARQCRPLRDWTLSTLQPVDRRCLALVRTRSTAGYGRDPRKMPTPRPCNGAASTAQLRRGGHRGDDFTLADIALGAYARRWFGSKASQTKLAQLDAGSRNCRPRRICAFVAPLDVVRVGWCHSGCATWRRPGSLRFRVRSFHLRPGMTLVPECSNSRIQKITTSVTTVTTRRVVSSCRGSPTQQRAAHHDGNDDIEWQSVRCCRSAPTAGSKRPRCLTAPPIFTQVSVPLTLTKSGPYAAQELLQQLPSTEQPAWCGLSGL